MAGPASGLRDVLTRIPRPTRGQWIAVGAAALAAVAILVFRFRASPEPAPQPIPVSDLAQRVKAGEIASLVVSDDRSLARTWGGQQLVVNTGGDDSMPKLLASFGVTPDELARVDYSVSEPPPSWLGDLVGLVPLIVFGAVLLFLLRRTGGAGNPAMSFGKSPARVGNADRAVVTFRDVAGVDESQQELQEVVEFLKFPEKFAALGARIPRGVLLVGPPGTGKTLLARAVAGEAGVPFFNMSGSEFVEMFVGVGASRVRDLFDRAKRQAPCIVFIDEIDAVGRQRGAGLGNANDEREQTLNQVLVELDGFEERTHVIVIAATNRPDVLDPALLRPGRFDRVVVVPAPDLRGRRAILDVHGRGKPFDATVALDTLARQTPGFSGADLANVLNEAAILAARRDKHLIGQPELEEAVERVVSGPERKSHVLSDTEKTLTAYHEAGHALVASCLLNHDPVHKITIIPRGLRIGSTRFLPPEDRAYQTRSQCTDALTSALSGHAAEILVFGETSTGASDDLERATSIARSMVKQFGMSTRLGPVAFGRKQQMAFLGRDFGEQRNYSERIGEVIDEEIRRLIDAGYAESKAILLGRRDALDRLASELVKVETLDGGAVAELLGGDAERAPVC
jgi:cell division protease FtsH